MASQPVTFPCPFCARRMGVPAELLGRQVRCPHCKQVVVAPTEAGSVPPPAPAVVSLPPPPPEPPPAPVSSAPPEPELRPLNVPQQKEGAESILSPPEESDDDVFGARPGARISGFIPEPPAQPQPPAHPFSFGSPPPAPAPTGGDVVPPFVTGTVFQFPPAPAPAPAPTPGAKQEPPDPFDDLGPPAPKPAPKPAPPPEPLPATQAPAPAASGNPFAALDAPPEPVKAKAPKAAPPADLPAPDEGEAPRPKKKRKSEDAEPEEEPARPAYGRAAAGSGGSGKTILLVLLAGYALLATLAAVYGLFFSSGAPPGHPLSTIPDNFGEFDPVSRKKVSRATFPVDGALPPEQRAALGGKINVGQLEIQPVRIEKRALVLQLEDITGKDKQTAPTREKALVLTLDIKNTSTDLPIFPMDPAFLRREGKDDQPITRLVTGKRVFYGGEIEWPLPAIFKKKAEVQQANDSIPLKPGESREYVVFTAAQSDIVRTAEAEKGPLEWRVQVRRGLIEYRGKEVPVTAVIGVDFRAGDIHTPTSG